MLRLPTACCSDLSRWKESREDLTKALELDEAARPGDPDPLLLNNLGNSEGALGNWDRALELYGRAAELNSPEIQARVNGPQPLGPAAACACGIQTGQTAISSFVRTFSAAIARRSCTIVNTPGQDDDWHSYPQLPTY